MSCQIEFLGAFSGAENMRRDNEKFLNSEKEAVENFFYLSFYTWQKKTISFGYSQKITELVNIKKASALDIDLVLRPTGGGMVFHQPGELTCALVADQKLFPAGIIPSCNCISEIIIAGLSKLGLPVKLACQTGENILNEPLCFARSAKYEVLSGDRKLLGSAQRRGKNVFLQQSSLPLTILSEDFAELIDITPLRKRMITVAELAGPKLDREVIAAQIAAEFKTYFLS